ncbi:CotY/CotZ family spore coat protein [Bacillus gaemokensis]|uniref:Spore coat protein n=1 Tax=Bacillus gaemokensis TaxID=574375 RepID=A0A073K6X9_9BACI|nr:CotY/CotZ family spore coat protein [Bacillus gaemokensis]KEK22232.1 spore coat protein [Bacillus gaemokensis]KYG30090.1 spore coat protein [Bacillus gaemokensis]
MSCNCNEDHHHHDFDFNCVCNVVRFIHELQECATTTCASGCEVPFLGAHSDARVANTRPFILFTKSGDPFQAFAPSGSTTFCQSPIFRVESIDDDCCAVLRVLTVFIGGEPAPPGDNPICDFLNVPNATLRATSSCITVDLNCFCAIQCLRDVSV